VEVVICLLFVLYLLPFAVAARHEHERLGWILAANFLLGWTVIGWFAVLHWARRPAPPPAEPAVRLRRGHLRLLEPPDGARPVPRLRVREGRRPPARRSTRP
jgi:hypothetical protein